MVFCTYCGQSFTRDEHLERHILTHTNVKPFKCFTCHMSFARRDLLQRHYTVHGKDQTGQHEIPAASGMIPKSAGRTPIACSNCAKTKTKCDKKFPCSRCAGRNLRCTLRPTRRVSKNAARANMPAEGAVAVPLNAQQAGSENNTQPSEVQQQPSPPAAPADSPQQPLQVQQAVTKDTSPKPTMASIAEDTQPANNSDTAGTQYPDQPSTRPTPPSSFSPEAHTTGFMQQTPLSGYTEFANAMSKDSSDDDSSPRFMLDWSQMQMPIGYDGLVQPHMIMNTEIGFDANMLSNPDAMLSILPTVDDPMASLVTPLETPKMERTFADLELSSSAAAYQQQRPPMTSMRTSRSIHSQASTPPSDINSELPEIIQAQDAWSVFRCTPILPSSACPRTAKRNLERLEDTLRNREGWASWSPAWDDTDLAGADQLTVMQLHESTRDKLLAITQSFLHKALEIHREGGNRQSVDSGYHTPNSYYGSNFVLLPPARVLEYFLRSYANSFERYFPLTSKGILDANELLHCYNDRAASLLVLMMIAQGAMSIQSTEARLLTGGLTEACRISLFDLIERNIIMSADPVVLHSALLFIVQAAWSGDKWQMDIAMGQRGMYLAMLRHSGMLDKATTSSNINQHSTRDQLWQEWISNESKSRLVYSWIMVDQDLALFHDTAPLFAVSEFAVPMPDADRLWQAKSAAEWSSIFEQVHEFSGGYSSVGSGARPLSLRDLFRHFLDDEMIPLGIEMTPLQLRLLLHPLQALVHQYSQLLTCFSESRSSRNQSQPRAVSASTTRNRLEEVQSLLGRWFDLAERYLRANPMCAVMQTNLVVFHLISLNAATNFPEIERLARRENFDGTYQQLVWTHKRCIHDVEEAIYHCGQILRIVRSMPRTVRPPWWAGAIYRAGLVLWTDSLTHKEQSSPRNNGMFPSVPGPSFAIDALPADHPLIIRYLTKREGVPCVTKRDGSQMSLDRAYPVLQHCIEVIDEGASNRFSDGIRSKIDKLARG
ncbi:hypothetical protein CB0940_09637 [Cercospora beticola]|uniref:Uncharacterized protein n=2 Tax=Cercospora beticola TaxID=122368 RepID=A0A2G5HGP0_CERBT|nr:hypothetical protein CB0940_09637 [Cercospora beticola]PIA91701.1 hypothetical protein CB0940_09637 [Cercospora beticola]